MRAALFYFQFTMLWRTRGLDCACNAARGTGSGMLDWLIGNCCDLLGVTLQNWMIVFAGVLIVYVAALCVLGRRRHSS